MSRLARCRDGGVSWDPEPARSLANPSSQVAAESTIGASRRVHRNVHRRAEPGASWEAVPMPALIVVALRLVVPLSILRWPLGGAILSMIVDALDVALVDAVAGLMGLPPEFGPTYAQVDKYLDTYYLAIEVLVCRRWVELIPRRAAYVLFAWRLVGVILFEITVIRPLLLVFPNLFENFYLYVQVARRWFPRYIPHTLRETILVNAILLIPKEIQEYVLHWEELHPWQWLRETFIKPLLGA
jgi:hypothetical protein